MLSRLKVYIKSLLAGVFFYGGFFCLFKFINNISGRRLTILAYHRVTNDDIYKIKASLPSLFITKDSFTKQLEFIIKHYKIIKFKELKTHIVNNDVPPNSLIITFDDGYKDNYQNAYPIMQGLNIPAVMFITVNKINHSNNMPYWWDRMYYYLREHKQWYKKGLYPDLDQEIQVLLTKFETHPSSLFNYLNREDTKTIDNLLNSLQAKYKIVHDVLDNSNAILQWADVRKMEKEVEVGSHTCNHYNLITLDQNEITYEIAGSLKTIKANTKSDIFAISYPCGNYNEYIKSKVTEAGYDFAVTTDLGINDLEDKYALKRISIWEGTSRGINGKFSKSLFAIKLMGL